MEEMDTRMTLLEMADGTEKTFGRFSVKRVKDTFEVKNGTGKGTSCNSVVAAKVIDGEFELEAVAEIRMPVFSFAEIRRKTLKIRQAKRLERVAG